MKSKTYYGIVLIIITLLSNQSVELHAQRINCRTTKDSRDPLKPCVFPFIFQGVKYDGCPPDEWKDENRRWCSTQVNSNGEHVSGAGKFGFCNDQCPIYFKDPANCKTTGGPAGIGVQCKIPFIWRKNSDHPYVQYWGCPVDPEDPSKTWCSTEIDVNGKHKTRIRAYGFCSNGCPKHKDKPVVGRNNAVETCRRSGEDCHSNVICSAQLSSIKDLKSHVCQLPDGSDGLCCKIKNGGKPQSVNPLIEDLAIRNNDFSVRNDNDAKQFNQFEIRAAAEIGQSFADNVTRSSRKTLKKARFSSFLHAQNQRQNPGIGALNKASLAFTEAARNLISGGGTTNFDTRQLFSVNVDNSVLRNQCKKADQFDCARARRSKYRKIDGSCNNLRNPKFGMSGSPLQRVLPNAYDDKISFPRTKAKLGGSLPSARFVSTTITNNLSKEDPSITALFVAFAQYLDHDLDHVPIIENEDDNEPISCCDDNDNGIQDLRSSSPENAEVCFPITIKRGDLGRDSTCLNFVRSSGVPNLDCLLGSKEQVNQITHWLDASNVYGSQDAIANQLRSNSSGLMNVIEENGQEILPKENRRCEDPQGTVHTCALAGDLRVNEQPTLGSMHALFIKEHNRIARRLKELNPNWNDEKLYQESKRIVNAEWQHIIYNEWLPLLIGVELLERFDLRPLTGKEFSDKYRDDFDPRVTNEFAAAAFRIGHTMVPDVIRLFNANTRRAREEMNLSQFFNNPSIVRDQGTEIIRGLTIQHIESVDNNFVRDLTDELFDEEGGSGGALDLVALNIQRARDHGIDGYVKYRELCKVGKASNFDDLKNNINDVNINRLRRAYDDVEDIDLFVGMILEDATDGPIGDTFRCLIVDVFARMRYGDRYFYDNQGQAGSFTGDQLEQIRKVSMARIICDNTDIEEVQPFAFRKVGPGNDLTKCPGRLFLFGIPMMDLSVFKE